MVTLKKKQHFNDWCKDGNKRHVFVFVVISFLILSLGYKPSKPDNETTTSALDIMSEVNRNDYKPSNIEDRMMESQNFCLEEKGNKKLMHTLIENFNAYEKSTNKFVPIPDLRTHVLVDDDDSQKKAICNKMFQFLPDSEIDGHKKQFSSMKHHGFLEPLLLQYPKVCGKQKIATMETDFWKKYYFVHDFERMCQGLTKSSETVFFDIGATIDFSDNYAQDNNIESMKQTPSRYLIETFSKFGFQFDHIYAYQKTKLNPKDVFNILLPEELLGSYHWINVAPSSVSASKYNPWNLLKQSSFSEEDLIVVSINIKDRSIADELMKQLLTDDQLILIVDQLYFFENSDDSTDAGSIGKSNQDNIATVKVKDRLALIQKLRKKGIAAHYWAPMSPKSW